MMRLILLFSFVIHASIYSNDHFLIILVDAPHFDYSNNHNLLETIARRPNHDVGHAWIHLQGIVNGRPVYVEGGHSGELGFIQARYFDGVMNYIHYGYASPTRENKVHRRHEPNPIKYLWETQHDGFFQRGNGNHRPTYAARIELTPVQFHRILKFIQPENYDYRTYNLSRSQCASFVSQVAAMADFPIECEVTMQINRQIYFRGELMTLWEDPQYSELTIPSPDKIEESLKRAVAEGKATPIYPQINTDGNTDKHR